MADFRLRLAAVAVAVFAAACGDNQDEEARALLARVRALVRRGGSERTERLVYRDVELDRLQHIAKRAGERLRLTPKEYQLLEFFLLHPEEVVRRTTLLEKVWDLHFDPMSNVVDVHVANLRQKLRGDDRPPLIHTVRGVGYVFHHDPPK